MSLINMKLEKKENPKAVIVFRDGYVLECEPGMLKVYIENLREHIAEMYPANWKGPRPDID